MLNSLLNKKLNKSVLRTNTCASVIGAAIILTVSCSDGNKQTDTVKYYSKLIGKKITVLEAYKDPSKLDNMTTILISNHKKIITDLPSKNANQNDKLTVKEASSGLKICTAFDVCGYILN